MSPLPYAVNAARSALAIPGWLDRPIDRDIKSLKLGDHFITEDLANAVLSGTITETVEGASSIQFDANDPSRKYLEQGLLKQWVRMNPPVYEIRNHRRRKVRVPTEWDEIYGTMDGRDYALAGVSKNQNVFTLTLENRAVNELRKYKKHKVWYRDVYTRAQAIHDLCKEVHGYHIPFFSPELNKVQPINLSGNKLSSADVHKMMQSGFAGSKGKTYHNSQVRVKGALASPQQLDIINRTLRTGSSMGGSYKVLVSSIMTITQESDVSLLNGSGGYGPFSQLRNGAWPASVTDVEADATAYFKIAMQVDAQQPSISLNDLCQAVQQSGVPNAYAQWESEAKNTVAVWSGGALAGSGSSGSSSGSQVQFQEYNRYAFVRGQNGTENSWEAATRWAGEVAWRLFMIDNTLYYVDDDTLFKQKPYDTISEKDDGIDEINYDIDIGKTVSTCTVYAHVDRWLCPPGAVVVVDQPGPAEGRWLVQQAQWPMYGRQAEITLSLPTPAKPEPSPSTKTISVSVPGSGGSSTVGSANLSGASSSVPGHPELKPGISKVVNTILSQFPNLRITSTTNHSQYTSSGNVSDHYTGHAADLADGTGGSQYMDQAGAWVQKNIGGVLKQGIHNPTLSINAGKPVPSSFWGSDWGAHINHLHVATYD